MTKDKDEWREPRQDELTARRIASLLIAFEHATVPLTSTDIQREFYPDTSFESFKRLFLKDRDRLARCGVVVERHSAGNAPEAALWQLNRQATLTDQIPLTQREATVLSIVCLRLVEDPSFPYREDLRVALAKVDRTYGHLTAARLSERPKVPRPVEAIVSAMNDRHAVDATYRFADGRSTRRTLAPFGSFGLHGHLYFVAAPVERGHGVCGPAHTYRADRFSSAKEVATERFSVPDDFSLADHARLPFQMGPDDLTVRFLVGDDANPDVMEQVRSTGATTRDERGLVWEVGAFDAHVAATYAIAWGIAPLSPTEVTDAWRATLEGALDLAPVTAGDREALRGGTEKPASTAKLRRSSSGGRQGALGEARELVALVNALGEEGDAMSVKGVATRLGVTTEHARHLLEMILTAGGESGGYLPLSIDDEDRIVLTFSLGAVGGKTVRLSHAETQALAAALDMVGLSSDDPLREKLEQGFAHVPHEDEPRDGGKVPSAPLSSGDERLAGLLVTCAAALEEGRCLSFVYRGVLDDEPRTRTARPLTLDHEDGHWYLEATDLPTGGHRRFRVDRMDAVEPVDAAAAPGGGNERVAADGTVPASPPQMVTLVFDDPSYLGVLYWPKLEVMATEGARTWARIPSYGGAWLVRHLCACGGHVQCDDRDVTDRARDLARRLLSG